MSKVYVGDTGTLLQLETGQNLAGASSATIEVRKFPTGTEASLAASVNGTKVQLISGAGTFDVAGEWQLQARVVMPSGAWRGEVVSLTVHGAFT